MTDGDHLIGMVTRMVERSSPQAKTVLTSKRVETPLERQAAVLPAIPVLLSLSSASFWQS